MHLSENLTQTVTEIVTFLLCASNGEKEIYHVKILCCAAKDSPKSLPSKATIFVSFLDVWKKQQRNVCFGTRDDTFGTFTMKDSGVLQGIKLVHKSGYVSCAGPSGKSNWGCGGQPLSTIITDDMNNILLPKDVDMHGWYTIPNFTSRSTELVLGTSSKHVLVTEGQYMRLWYGEDLKDYIQNRIILV